MNGWTGICELCAVSGRLITFSWSDQNNFWLGLALTWDVKPNSNSLSTSGVSFWPSGNGRSTTETRLGGRGFYFPLPFYFFSLLLFADFSEWGVHCNPGPGARFPCGDCLKPVRCNQAAIQCDLCDKWWHFKCSLLSPGEFDELSSGSHDWFCQPCQLANLPFHDVSTLSLAVSTDSDSSQIETRPLDTSGNNTGYDETHSRRARRNRSCNIWYNNCRSVKNKIPELQVLLSSKQGTIFCFTETWLQEGFLDGEIFPTDQFSIFRKDRTTKRGGGVMFCVPQSIPATRRVDLEMEGIELLWIEVQLDKRYLLGVCYWPPDSPIETLHSLGKSFREIDKCNGFRNVLLLGDFNLPLQWNVFPPTATDTAGTTFLDLVASAGLTQICRNPTYTTHNGNQRFLDLAFVRDLTGIIDCTVEEGIGSDHLAIAVSFEATLPRTVLRDRNIMQFAKGDIDHLFRLLSCINWDLVLGEDCIEAAWSNWLTAFRSAIDDSIPTVRISQAKVRHPWIDREVLKLSTKKRVLFRKALRLGDVASLNMAKAAQRQLKYEIRRKKSGYLSHLSDKARLDPRGFWSAVSSLRKQHASLSFKVEDRSINDPSEIAERFSQHFSTKWTKPHARDMNFLRQMPEAQQSISTVIFSREKVLEAILQLDAYGAWGPDSISPKILRLCAVPLCSSRSTLFQKSLDQGKLPADWKRSWVSPIFKGGSLARDNLTNYRPVSLTSVVVRTMERIINDELQEHLSSNNLLPPTQFGFRRGRSCEQALLNLTHSWSGTLDEQPAPQIDVVFFDFEAAFDKAAHDLLQYKIRNRGIDGPLLQWSVDFLQGREQSVVYKGSFSRVRLVLSGVPQGSVLGPTFFSIFVFDLPTVIKVPNVQFADDLTLHNKIEREGDEVKLQEAIDRVEEWSCSNELPLNSSKCAVMRITRAKNPIPPHYHLGAMELTTVNSQKLLGVTLTSKLTWNDHVHPLCVKANQLLGFCTRFAGKQHPGVFITLYTALVLPTLEYCSAIWDPHQSHLVTRIESVQRRASMIAWSKTTGHPFKERPSYAQRLKLLGWRDLTTRRKLTKLKLLYKILVGVVPRDTGLLDLVPLNHRTKRVCTPLTRTLAHQGSTIVSSCKLWSSLPRAITDTLPASLTEFCQAVRPHLQDL